MANSAGGWVLSFSPTALVWHYRRFTLRAFLTASGFMAKRHIAAALNIDLFRPDRTAKWRGQIYGTTLFSGLLIAR